jgi:hypothetical protein
MNAARRKLIDHAIADIEVIRGLVETIKEAIDYIREDEQGAFDNLPESLQDGEKGEAITASIDALENAYSGVDDIDSTLEDVASNLSEAKGS